MSKFCMNCGSELPDIAKFCPKCGASAKAPTCPACGEKIDLGQTFCMHCGANLKKETSAPAASSEPTPETQPEAASASMPEPPKAPPAPEPPPKKKVEPPPVCPRCGKQTVSGYDHCVYCGTYWDEPVPVKAQPAENPTAWDTILQEPASQLGSTSQPKTRRPVWPFVLVGIALCAVIAALIYYSTGEKGLNDREQSLVGTWDAYYMIVGDESTGVREGEMRLNLGKQGGFIISTSGESAEGKWSCPNSKTLALDYGGGNVVEMSVGFISDREIETRAKDEDILISWRRR